MNSAFLGLNIARTGLLINQKNLEITSKNIANANTEGYTRQRVIAVPANYNQGVQYVNVEQIRDNYLDSQFRSESSLLGEWRVKSEAMISIEDFVIDPSDYGLNKSIDDFFNSLQELSNAPESYEMRSQVRQNAINLTDKMHYLYNKFIELQDNQDGLIETTVYQINQYADVIKSYNEQIKKMEIRGQKANELRDQRNLILDKLSELVDISVTENNDGTVSVMIGSAYLVDKDSIRKIDVIKDKPNPIDGESLLNSVKWADNGEDVSLNGGSLKGYLDIRDGTGITESDSPKSMGIPYFVNKLNIFSKAIAKSINDIQISGYTIPNVTNGNISQVGLAFFVPDDINELSAKNIAVSNDILNSVFNIATSDVPVDALNKGNCNIASQMAALRNIKDIIINIEGDDFYVGSFNEYSKQFATEIALESNKYINKRDGQEITYLSVKNRRLSLTGVSIDEELANMIQFQQAYNAAARMISVINENLDILINRL